MYIFLKVREVYNIHRVVIETTISSELAQRKRVGLITQRS